MQNLPTPDAPASIGARLAAATQRLADLRREQGAALLDGQPFDHGGLTEAENEIAALNVAETESVRREREVAAKAVDDAHRKMRRKIGKQEQKRLAAVERAERAANELASALKEALETGTGIEASVRVLGHRPIRYLEANDYERRLSCRLAWAFLPLTGPSRAFGQISFPDSGMYRVPWRQAETTLVGAAINLATQGNPDAA
ncbi:hypothetical protein ACSBOB_20390 [Mesorhizobium sp. ASY16-5R]|uniref:hypothetical protein n=1 Tax=Mesorhizobium sp. ASY16-5R TaxID=3445772 RepID=UPI003F9F340F